MKKLFTALAGVGFVGMVFAVFGLVFLPIVLTIWGVVLAFKASIVLGVIVLLVEPSPLILGVLALFGHGETAQRIAAWLGL